MTISQSEQGLQTLLRTIAPSLLEGSWAFATAPKGKPMPAGLKPLMPFLDEPELAKSGLQHACCCLGHLAQRELVALRGWAARGEKAITLLESLAKK